MKEIKKEKTAIELFREEGKKRAAMSPEELKKYDAKCEEQEDGIYSMPSDGIMAPKNTPKN